MENKVYTAQEMREMAQEIEGAIALNGLYGPKHLCGFENIASAMLRQAADLMEHSEKEYEYKVLYRRRDGRVYDSIGHTQDIQLARETLGIYSGYKDAHIVRRAVGEWEEVRDGE